MAPRHGAPANATRGASAYLPVHESPTTVNELTHDRPTLYLLDGHALIYRAFFAMISRPLTTSKGENTSAPFGLSRFLVRILDEYRPDYVVSGRLIMAKNAR